MTMFEEVCKAHGITEDCPAMRELMEESNHLLFDLDISLEEIVERMKNYKLKGEV